MIIRPFSILLVLAIPAAGLAQLSVFDAAYRIEADAQSGASQDSHTSFMNSVGPQQNFFDRVDSFASESTSWVHSYASVGWNCTPTDLDAELVACWDSVDDGAGNRGHMFSQLYLGFSLGALSFVTTAAGFDPPNSTMAIDIWNGFSWVQHVSSIQIVNYAGWWNPGDYRLRTQRLYDPVGDSTGCASYNFRLHAEPVPEPGSILALSLGGLFLVRRRKAISKACP